MLSVVVTGQPRVSRFTKAGHAVPDCADRTRRPVSSSAGLRASRGGQDRRAPGPAVSYSLRVPQAARCRTHGVDNEMRVRERKQVSASRRQADRAWLLYACSGSAGVDAVVTASVLAVSAGGAGPMADSD